jgi:hypothetical protein
MWVKIWPVIIFNSTNISQANSERWKVQFLFASTLLLLALMGQTWIWAVGGSFLFFRGVLFIITILIGYSGFTKLGNQYHNRSHYILEGSSLRTLVTALYMFIPTTTLAISNMATPQMLAAEIILLLRSQGMVTVFLEETVINYGIGYIWDPRGTSLPVWVVAPSCCPASKTDFRKNELWILSLLLLDKGGQ